MPRLGLLILLPLLLAPRASAHPQDGPHADIRFLVTDSVLRLNLGVNLAFIDEIAPPARESLDAVDPVEEPAIRSILETFATERLRVVIDDRPADARLVGFEFQRPDLALLGLFPRFGHRALLRAHATIEFPIESAPEEVAITWDVFPPDHLAEQIEGATGDLPPMVLEARFDGEGRLEILRFSETEPTATWRATGMSPGDLLETIPLPESKPATWNIPLVTAGLGVVWLVAFAASVGSRSLLVRVVLIGLPLTIFGAVLGRSLAVWSFPDPFAPKPGISHEAALAVFRPLHANMYRAFDFTAEDDIYDALALSVDGPLLDELYNDIYQSLVMRDQEGAVARVTDLRPLETELTFRGTFNQLPAFGVNHRWRVEGTVYHWGHSHARTNEYTGSYTVTASDGAWRITDHEITAQKRLDTDDLPLTPQGDI